MKHSSVTRLTATVGIALALVLASCSVSDSDKSASGSTTTAAGSSGPDYAAKFADTPVQGLTATTIKLGLALVDYAKVKEQFGVDLAGGGDPLPAEVVPALVDSVNDKGGINGRKIEIAKASFVPVGTESSEESCRKLIEDDKVFAVIGMYLGDNSLCVTETHKTPYFAGWGLNDERKARSKAPLITVQDSDENVALDQMKVAIDAGVFKGKKVAVYWDSETPDSVIDKQVIGTLKDAGVDVVSKAKLPQSGDQVKAGNDIDTIFQRFQADGADALVVWSGLGVPIPALQRTSWNPLVVFTNGQANGNLDGYGLKDPTKLKGDLAVMGSIPSPVMEKDPDFLKCLDTINAHSDLDLKPTDVRSKDVYSSSVGATFVPQVCQIFDLTVKVLEAAGDDPSASSIVKGLKSLQSFSLPGIPKASLSPTKWGAGMQKYLWHWDVAKAQFVRDDEPTGN